MNRAHTLAEVVEAHWAPSEHWLIVRLRRGELRGRKIGRDWFMTDADVEFLAEKTANRPAQPAMPADVARIGLSTASARRRAG